MNRRDALGSLLSASLVVAVAVILYQIRPEFFFKDDFQLQFLPGSREVARAWSSGSFPWLNPYSWFSGALAAEYQFGVFSLFRGALDVVVWAIPASLGARAAMLFIAHAAVLGGGGYLLARSYDVRPSLATMVAVIAALNGWMLWWGTTWFVAIAGFAWIPWYWLALRCIASGQSRWGWAGAAAAIYLVLTAGSPYVVGIALAVALMNFLAAMAGARRRTALVMTVSSLLGLCLAAPAVLMLIEFFPSGARMAGQRELEAMWVVPPAGLFGFVVPSFSASWIRFLDRSPHAAVELLGCFVPLAALVGAFFTRGRELLRRLGPEFLLGGGALLLAMLPSQAPLRWSFHWLPLVHLVLAIVGACALEKVRRPWMWGIGLVVLALAAAPLFDHAVRTTWLHGAVLISICIAWGLAGRTAFSAAIPLAITLVTIIGTFAVFSNRGDVPVFANAGVLLEQAPFDPSRRYLAMYDAAGIGLGAGANGRSERGLHVEMRPGNTPLLAGLEFINGYSPVGPEGQATIFRFESHGTMPSDRAEQILRLETGRNQLLHHLGVDGLLVPQAMALRNRALLTRNGWAPVARVGVCLLLHRRERDPRPVFTAALAVKAEDDAQAYRAIGGRTTPQLPVVLLTPGRSGRERYGQRLIGEVEQTRLQTRFTVRGKGPKALVVFRRPWLPGLYATLNGAALPVLRADMLMPAVEIPAGTEGEVVLLYRPRSLVTGAWIAGLAVLVLAAASIRILRNGPSTEHRDLR